MSDVNTKPIGMEADEEAVDVDKIMAEFDKESNTRHFSGIFQKIIKAATINCKEFPERKGSIIFDGIASVIISKMVRFPIELSPI